ncbi:MAG: hypothetical protein N3C63_03880 [Rhodocyclaceae bacterium]|nr:hypothetical protein [Rhodocyclaceae bacterium]
MPHLFADISAHGFGHLAQAAPVLNALAARCPALKLTVRSALPVEKLRERIRAPFMHLQAASDIGFVMIDAFDIDLAATAQAYRAFHADFAARVAAEAALFNKLAVDLVFSDVAYLPLAGAARAGLPAIALCSLNWADLFAHFFGCEAWAAPLLAEMLADYQSAPFLRATPAMPMPTLVDTHAIGPLAVAGQARREALAAQLGARQTARLVLVSLGGIPTRLPVEHWPATPDLHWLVPAAWQPCRADMSAIEPLGWPFADLFASVDAVLTKPGYGTFVEAAVNGTAVLYLRRPDWPEQDVLIDWLHAHARAAEISTADLAHGRLSTTLDRVLASPAPPRPIADGAAQAAAFIAARLSASGG